MKKLGLSLIFAGAMALLFFAPTSAEAGSCPKNCVSWYDGCNTCGCKNGKTTFCTRRACLRRGKPYCKKYARPTLSCKTVKCPKYRYCKMIGKRPRCICRRLAIKCARGYITAYKVINRCRIPYCKKKTTLTCKTVKCPRYRYCKMIGKRPRCICRRVAIKCARGYTTAYKVINRCRIPYCKKKTTITCKNVRCRSPRRCRMVKNRPICQCPRLAIRCAPGYISATKIVGGCKIPYCKKACKRRCPTNCSRWYDGCNWCSCVKGCLTVCTKRACKKRTRPYCAKKK